MGIIKFKRFSDLFVIFLLTCLFLTGCKNASISSQTPKPDSSNEENQEALRIQVSGFESLHSEKYDDAVEKFTQASSLDPSLYESYYGLGKAYFYQRKFKESEDSYRKALSIKPNHGASIDGIGAIYHLSKKYDIAIGYFKKAIEADPKYGGAYDNMGFAYFYKQDYENSLKYFNKSIEIDPNFADSYLGRGKVYVEIVRNDKAVLDFTKALELKSSYFEAHRHRGLIYADMLKYDEAIADLNAYLAMVPESPDIYYERGTLYYWKGDFKKALSDLNISLEMGARAKNNSSDEIDITGDIIIMQGLTLKKLGRKKESDARLKEGIKLFEKEDSGESDYDKPGYAYIELGNPQKAIYYFNREPVTSKHKYPGRAIAYMAVGNLTAAAKDLETAKKILPESWERSEVLKLLKNLQNK